MPSIDLDDIYKTVHRWEPTATQALKDTKHRVNWTWEALQGDFNLRAANKIPAMRDNR